jgi:Zn-dependent protease with chaperone function
MIEMDINNLENSIREVYNSELESRELYNEEFNYAIENDILLNENVQFVNEAYVGKTPILEEIEKQIGVIRMNLSRYMDFDSNKEVQKLNRLFEQQFGMDVFALHMNHHKQINAYTMVYAKNFDVVRNADEYPRWIIADREKGYRFKPNNNICISAVIFYGLLANPDFTDAEILAIILHELGHNFADFIDKKIRIANVSTMVIIEVLLLREAILTIIKSAGLLTLPALIKYKSNRDNFNIKKKRKHEIKKQEKDPSELKGGIKGGIAKIEDDLGTVREVLSRLSPLNILINKFSVILRHRKPMKNLLRKSAQHSIDRRNEIIADKFAGIYGYAYELGSALEKMRYQKTSGEKIVDMLPGGKKINRIWKDLYKDITEFDCHPHNIQRINENIKLLKDELEQADMDPKMKNVIKEQIRELEKLNKEIAEKVKKDPDNTVAAYDAYVYKKLPDATTDKIEQEIADEFNKLLQKQK